jgi:hypothetical protein
MKNKNQIVNEYKFSECYWNNLNTITIFYNHSWQELDDNGKWVDFKELKISEIYRGSDGYWIIREIKSLSNSKMIEYIENLSKDTLIPNWVFPRAFKDIYNEMKLQFKIMGKSKQLTLLKNIFQRK